MFGQNRTFSKASLQEGGIGHKGTKEETSYLLGVLQTYSYRIEVDFNRIESKSNRIRIESNQNRIESNQTEIESNQNRIESKLN